MVYLALLGQNFRLQMGVLSCIDHLDALSSQRLFLTHQVVARDVGNGELHPGFLGESL